MTIVYACRHVSRQGPVEPVIQRRMRCPRCRGKKKEPRSVTTIFLSLLCLLAIATPASAECAWVVWAHGLTLPSMILAAHPSRQECERDLSVYAASFKRDGYAVHGAYPGSRGFDVEKGDKRNGYLCLPDTVDPRGPKGK